MKQARDNPLMVCAGLYRGVRFGKCEEADNVRAAAAAAYHAAAADDDDDAAA